MRKMNRTKYVILCLAIAICLPSLAMSQSRPAQTPAAQKAGSVTALLPITHIVRGLGKSATMVEAKKGDDLVWNDLVRTERGGRVRITLLDQSVLSLGSQAELRIIKHDSRSQQTALQLGYGRVRAEVASVTRNGGSFELRTPTAVAGVIGTDFGTDSSLPGVTTFLCIAGTVSVGNNDPNVPGTVPCPAGTTTTVQTGQKPTQPKPITQQQIQQLIQDTEPATISALSPSSALQGTSLVATATGTKMSGMSSVGISGTGVNVTLATGNTDTSTSVNMTLAADATPGPRTITFTKSNSQTTAAVFTVLAPPSQTSTLDINALKAAYSGVIDQERQSEISGINSIGAGVQQSANLGGQQIVQANNALMQPLELKEAEQEIVADVAPLLTGMATAGTNANQLASTATINFGKDVDAAITAAKAATPPPTDDALKSLIKSIFDKDNAALQTAFTQNRSGLGNIATSANSAITASVTKWLNLIQNAATDQAKGSNITGLNPNEGKQGTTIQVTATGDHLAGMKSITASGNGVTAKPNQGETNDKSLRFTIVIAPDATAGVRTLTFTRANGASGTAQFTIVATNVAPTPKIDNTEKSFDIGVYAQPAFDASSSSGNNGASVNSVNWDLCDSSYRPTATGIPLPGSDTRCRPLNTYSSNQPAYYLQTCNLAGGDYAARVTVVDSNQMVAKMDALLHILPAGYDNPTNRIQNLAQTYATLQPEQFLAFFDQSYSGYTQLAENIRNTFGQLQSMTINLQVSQVNVNCNDADVRATWQQNYTFKADQTCSNVPAGQACQRVVFIQNENLTMHMTRVPGKGWYITSIQGDSGKVQGQPPGPVQTSTTAPDLTISSGTIQTANGGTSIAPGNNTFLATVQNIGNGPLSATDGTTAGIRFSVVDSQNHELVATQISLPAIAAGASVVMQGVLSVPDVGPNTPITVIAEVNHNCVLQTESNCSNNTGRISLTLGSLDLAVSNLRAVSSLIATQSGVVRVDIKNQGSSASVAQTGNLILTAGTAQLGTANIPVITPGQTVSVDVNFSVPNTAPFGSQAYTATIKPNSEPGDTNPANDTVTTQVTILPAVDLTISGLNLPSGMIATLSGTATVQVKNNGALNYTPGANDRVNLLLNSSNLVSVTLPAIASGASTTINLPFTLPNVSGTGAFSATIAPAPATDVITTDKVTTASANIISGTVDLKLNGLAFATSTRPPFLSGQTVTMNFTVQNNGNVGSAANDQFACSLTSPTAGTQTFNSITLPALTAGQSSAPQTYNFVVPVNFSGNDTVSCTISQDPLEASGKITDNTQNLSAIVSLNVDLQLINVPTPPVAFQIGQTGSVQFTVKNFGPDSSPAGYNVVLSINGQQAGTVVSTVALSGLGGGTDNTSLTVNYTVPFLGNAPLDNTFPSTVVVNANGAVAETNTSNNTFSFTARVVDFKVVSISGQLNGIVGRSFTVNNAVAIFPPTYPLALAVNYANLPAGLNPSGTIGANITGIPVAPTTGNITPNVLGGGVLHSGSSISTVVKAEIAFSEVSVPVFTAGGSTQNLQLNVTGGISPVTVTLTLPTGITTTGPVTQLVSTPGVVTFTLSAGITALTGLQNFSVNGLDVGVVTTSTAAGNVNFNAPYNVNGVAPLSITGFTVTGHSVPPITGANAFETGEAFTQQVTVSNSGNTQPTGNFVLSLTCIPGCGTPLTGSAAVPPPGQSVVVSVPSVNFNLPAGSYQETITFSSVPTGASAGVPFGPQTFEVFDFLLANANPMPVQNVPTNGFGTWQIQLTEPGVITPLSLNYAGVTPVTSGVTNNSGGTLANGGTATLTVNAGSGVVTGSSETISASITRLGVTKTASQAMRFYTASLNNVSSGSPGSGSGNAIQLPIGGTSFSVNYKLFGTFSTAGGPATLVPNPVTGINFNISSVTALPGDTLTITLSAVTGATANVVTPINLTFNIPNTVPQQTVSAQIFVLPLPAPDLTITSITGTNAFLSRVFSNNPLLSGEAGDFNVAVSNTGGSPSAPNLNVRIHLGSLTGTVIGQSNIGASIAAGGSVSVPLHIHAPDPLTNNPSNILVAEVQVDPAEVNTANNSLTLPVGTADWALSILGTPGTSASPLVLSSLSPSNAIVQITLGSGTSVGPFTLIAGATATGINSTTFPATITSPLNKLISINTLGSAQQGQYAMQVIAQIKDGSIVTATRSTVIFGNVNGGAALDTVAINSSRSNNSFSPSTCTSTCIPIQINGPLVESTTLTVVRSGGTTGQFDMFLSDDPSVVSNVTATGQPQLQSINGVTYNSPVQFNVTANEAAPNGTITTGLAKVAVSAVNIGTVARQVGVLPTIGSQQTYLFYNVGDLAINLTPGTCIVVPPNGGNVSISVSWTPLNGFNNNLTWTWIGLPPGLSVNIPNGNTPFSGGYSPNTFIFTNNNAANITGLQNLTLQVMISNGNGTASKFFPIQMNLNSTACGGTSFGAHQAGAQQSGGGSLRINGTWKVNPNGNGAMATATPRAGGKLPDLSIKATDVSISPSVPKQGDVVSVRFKLNNAGDADAIHVPIALEVNGSVVALDVFDIAAGRTTLGGITWNTANWQGASSADALTSGTTPYRKSDRKSNGDTAHRSLSAGFNASLVIDPGNTIKQKTVGARITSLSQLALRPPVEVLLRGGNAPVQRAIYELAEGCNGVRISTGSIAPCESGELDFNVDDLAAGHYSVNSSNGVADLGAVDVATADVTGAQFTSHISAMAGHTYAVQLSGGRMAFFTLSAVLSPRQLEALAGKKFNGGAAVNVIRQLGGGGGNIGDVAQSSHKGIYVYFDLRIHIMQ